jgi:hypothetical protein
VGILNEILLLQVAWKIFFLSFEEEMGDQEAKILSLILEISLVWETLKNLEKDKLLNLIVLMIFLKNEIKRSSKSLKEPSLVQSSVSKIWGKVSCEKSEI